MTVPETAWTGSTLGAGTHDSRADVLLVKSPVHSFGASFFWRLRLPGDFSHPLSGFRDLVAILEGVHVSCDAQSGVRRNAPLLVGKANGPFPSCADRAFPGGASG